DEIVYQTTYRLNRALYASTGEKRAFVLSHGRDLLVLKMVGYGDDVVRFYQLEDLPAGCGSAITAIRPRDASGIPAALTRFSACTRRWCTTATSPTTPRSL